MNRDDLKTAGLYLAGCLLLAGAVYGVSHVPVLHPWNLGVEQQLVDLEDRVQELERRPLNIYVTPAERALRPDIWGAPCASCGDPISGPSTSCGEWWHQGAETTDMGDDR